VTIAVAVQHRWGSFGLGWNPPSIEAIALISNREPYLFVGQTILCGSLLNGLGGDKQKAILKGVE
jgi:hypothetical protein